MPTVNEIVKEFKTIAEAQNDVGAFLLADPADVNNFRDKKYPMLIVDRSINIESLGLKTRQRVYVVRIYFFDVATAETSDLEIVGEKFLQEFRARYRDQGLQWRLENEDSITGTWGFNRSNDRLHQICYLLRIRSQGECVTGDI